MDQGAVIKEQLDVIRRTDVEKRQAIIYSSIFALVLCDSNVRTSVGSDQRNVAIRVKPSNLPPSNWR